MILHASLAKLNRYNGDQAFDRVIREIQAANEEGLDSYDVEIDNLDPNITLSIVVALENMGYNVTYERGDETLYVSNND